MQHTKQILAAALAALLVACGGGGGGGEGGGPVASPPPAANNPPTISGAPITSVEVGDSYSFTPTASDEDGNTLSFTLQNAPIWLVIDSGTGEISGDPTQGHIGSADDISITVSDGKASASLAPFAITVMPEVLGRVEFPESYSASIGNSVTEALDRRIAEVEDKIAELEEAVSDCEFEVSLRGIRESLPAMMDAAVVTLNAIPGEARKEARSETLSYLREALREALSQAYANRNVGIKVSLSKSFGTPFNKTYTVYSRDNSEQVLSTADAENIKTARDNVYPIQETSDIKISAQEVVDRLPTEEAIEQMKTEVKEGTASIPTVNGLGYRAFNDTYEAFVTIDNEDQDIEINVLSPSDVREGVGNLLADILLR
jgi:hypothetical protein